MNDPDIWWHMRNAQYLFQHHQFPRFDTYSFTVAGHPWINHGVAERSSLLFGLSGIRSRRHQVSDVFPSELQFSWLLLYLCYQESRNFKASVTVCYYATFPGDGFVRSADNSVRILLSGRAADHHAALPATW